MVASATRGLLSQPFRLRLLTYPVPCTNRYNRFVVGCGSVPRPKAEPWLLVMKKLQAVLRSYQLNLRPDLGSYAPSSVAPGPLDLRSGRTDVAARS